MNRGVGYNLYGGPAWPNDILYALFAITLSATTTVLGVTSGEPTNLGDHADPSTTPLEVLPEQYFHFTLNLLRILPDKLIGIAPLIYIPVLLLLVPILRGLSKPQNPPHRPILTITYLPFTQYSFWLGVGSLVPILDALPLIQSLFCLRYGYSST